MVLRQSLVWVTPIFKSSPYRPAKEIVEETGKGDRRGDSHIRACISYHPSNRHFFQSITSTTMAVPGTPTLYGAGTVNIHVV